MAYLQELKKDVHLLYNAWGGVKIGFRTKCKERYVINSAEILVNYEDWDCI